MKLRRLIAALLLPVLLALPSLTGCGGSQTYFLLSASTFSLWGQNAGAAEREMTDFLRALEQDISLKVADSDLSRLNAARAGERVTFGTHTLRIWERCQELSALTGGAFSPALYPLTELWGFDGDQKRVPDMAERERAKALCSMEYFVTEGSAVYKTIDGAKLDFGGIAKGYAADVCREIAVRRGVQGFINLGGNIYVVGKKQDGSLYRVGIQHPRRAQGATFALVNVTDASIVTSGDYQNYFERNGVRYCHIMDGASGAPAGSGLISVTLVDRDSCRADALGTALFVMGMERAERFAKENGLDYLLIEESGANRTNLQLSGVVA